MAELQIDINQMIEIDAESKYFEEVYKSKVLAINSDHLLIKIPYHKRQPILFGVGTKIKVTAKRIGDDFNFYSEIIDRDLDQETFKIIRPDGISRYKREYQEGMTKVIAVTSGKGGVGKSTFTSNLAVALAQKGKKVSLIDADLGTANLDILLNIQAEYNLRDVIEGEKALIEVVHEGPEGIILVPGGSGFQDLTKMGEGQFSKLISSFNQLDNYSDLILIDTAAGVSENVTNFLLAADETIVVTTPEPHSIIDAYSIIKVVAQIEKDIKIKLVVNKADNEKEARQVADKMKYVVKEYIGLDLEFIGYVTMDLKVLKAIKQKEILVLSYPRSKASKGIKEIAVNNFLENNQEDNPGGLKGFMNKLKSIIS
ncbi:MULTISPECIES: P-loop NTPase [unclassified Candidatus Frackibacter]|uniref:P-loop NTPase n=1 Tax=unclassified Candidatus Frackibacter TaxID=2648818 RepID=UPI0007945C38|nr:MULTISPECIES: P-loop NTPase [unclassified Candidatus Frackibacter]KXS40400.1 MAG: flagellar biosynthesis protein FlhG [Candidatus Frackibacter sp. T328-2]SDC37564.1 flagellar biosynthesis protein FlhG [Candidatus Frackibacter sp. WG11]SEM62578.1 flagellar biosynthesis protein FlhG [Candidatus Frackibacter sp. WG12]SFL65232.1 flagellar biosynthesis protein FlhG [Candidatus Frackibacter sp. WG13]